MNLTESPVQTTTTPLARFTNEFGHEYSVYFDDCAGDPRDSGDFMAPTYVPGTDTKDRAQSSDLFILFDQITQEGHDELPDSSPRSIVEFINHLNQAKDIAPGETLHVFTEYGYTQGDVWDILVIETDDLLSPDMSAAILAGYLRGDVYGVSCSCGEDLWGIEGFGHGYDKVAEYFADNYCPNPASQL